MWFRRLKRFLHVCGIAWISDDRGEIAVLRKSAIGFADKNRDEVTSVQGFFQDELSGAACCTDEEDLREHGVDIGLGVKDGSFLEEKVGIDCCWCHLRRLLLFVSIAPFSMHMYGLPSYRQRIGISSVSQSDLVSYIGDVRFLARLRERDRPKQGPERFNTAPGALVNSGQTLSWCLPIMPLSKPKRLSSLPNFTKCTIILALSHFRGTWVVGRQTSDLQDHLLIFSNSRRIDAD